MSLIIKKLIKGYHHVIYDLSDTRANELFLVSSPIPIFLILVAYYQFIYNYGPKFMEKRAPFKLDKIMYVYNAFQIFANTYMVVKCTKIVLAYDIFCTPVDYSNDPDALATLDIAWMYYMTKILDLLDTVFFVLRKKYNQITFLHVYHHIGMAAMVWYGVKYIGGGHSVYLGYINAIVHTIMYTYYLLAAWNSEYKKSIWWKKYITQLQLLQFLLLIIIYGQLLFRKDCRYPTWVAFIFVPQNFFMLVLFSDFYWKTYVKPKKQNVVNEKREEKTDKCS